MTTQQQNRTIQNKSQHPSRPASMTTKRVARKLDISLYQFRRLVQRLGIKPDSYGKNPDTKFGPQCELWSADVVKRVKSNREYRKSLIRAYRLRQTRRRRERDDHLAGTYASFDDALAAAAKALFSLNRYAKHRACSRDQQKDIYGLKSRFIEILYAEGRCVNVGRHHRELPGADCYYCDIYYSIAHPSDAKNCPECKGTGWFKPPRTVSYLVFSFEVDGQRYCWHQPEELVRWPCEVTSESVAWDPGDEEKSLEMPLAEIPNAKELVEWVCRVGQQYKASLTINSTVSTAC